MSLEKAKSTLVHYFRTVWQEAGLKWDSDNVTEIEGIVEDIAAGVRREIEEQEEDAEEIRSRIRNAREGRG